MRAESTLPHQDFLFYSPARLVFGEGARHRLAPLLQRLGWRRVAFVCDPYFARPGEAGSELFAVLRASDMHCAVFGDCRPDPSLGQCDAAQAQLMPQGPFDCVVALGGGSAMDLAKVLCLTLAHGGPAARFVGIRLEQQPLPLVALPTTSGTASELTPGAILVAGEHEAKVAIMGNGLRACLAIVDPELSLSCPPQVTADAGVDALTHAVESFLTLDSADFDREGDVEPGYAGRNPLTRLFAMEAMKLCHAHLQRAWSSPQDREARNGMALASVYAGYSYASAGLNAVHALAYGVASVCHASHGTTCAVMLPYVMSALAAERGAELAELAALFHAPSRPETHPDPARQAAWAVRNLIGSVGVATDLRRLGVREDQLTHITEAGLGVSRLTKAFPGGRARERFPAIVRAAYTGELGLPSAAAA